MAEEDPELLPRWREAPPAAPVKPRGLLDELVEEGLLVKELAVRGHTYRVASKIHCDERACLFRCAVSCDGKELQAPPWTAVFRDLGTQMAGRVKDAATRRELAHEALEVHLEMCTQVGRALERHGRLVAARRSSASLLVAAGAILLVLGAVAVWWALRAGAPRGAARDVARIEPPEVQQAAAPGGGGQQYSAAEASELAPGEPPGATGLAPAPAPDSPPPEGVSKPAPGRPANRESRRPAAIQAREGSSASKEPPPPEPEAVALEPPPAEPAPRRWPVAEVVSPADHSTVRLLPGEQIYFNDPVRVVSVPRATRNLRCVTTREAAGDTKQGIAIELAEPATVWVMFDSGVKRRPAWLGAFEPTGDTLTAREDGAPDRMITYQVLRKQYPAGGLSLDSNTEAGALVRRAKLLAHRTTFMYLVCVAEVEGDERPGGGRSGAER